MDERASLRRVWRHMLTRCAKDPNYAGRGISVCDRWRDSFEAFVEDMGPRPIGWTLDRIDNDGDYGPSNCRWASVKDNTRNRRKTVRVMFRGEMVPFAQVVEESGINYHTLLYRLECGMTADQAVSKPVRKPRNRPPARVSAISPSPRPSPRRRAV